VDEQLTDDEAVEEEFGTDQAVRFPAESPTSRPLGEREPLVTVDTAVMGLVPGEDEVQVAASSST
jgi:hypothetical protein